MYNNIIINHSFEKFRSNHCDVSILLLCFVRILISTCFVVDHSLLHGSHCCLAPIAMSLLGFSSQFSNKEESLENASYVGVLIAVLSAASTNHSIWPVLTLYYSVFLIILTNKIYLQM